MKKSPKSPKWLRFGFGCFFKIRIANYIIYINYIHYNIQYLNDLAPLLESQVPGRGKEILLFTRAPELLSSHSKSQMQGLISIFIDMHPRGSLQAGVAH